MGLPEEKCFKFSKQSRGLDEALLQATREHEHKLIIEMMSKAVSYVMAPHVVDLQI